MCPGHIPPVSDGQLFHCSSLAQATPPTTRLSATSQILIDPRRLFLSAKCSCNYPELLTAGAFRVDAVVPASTKESMQRPQHPTTPGLWQPEGRLGRVIRHGIPGLPHGDVVYPYAAPRAWTPRRIRPSNHSSNVEGGCIGVLGTTHLLVVLRFDGTQRTGKGGMSNARNLEGLSAVYSGFAC